MLDGLDKDGRDSVVQMLNEKFPHEMTPDERKRAEWHRRAVEIGAIQGMRELMKLQRPVGG